ncbi:MAG: putative rane associated hydrolase, partial [Bacteroidetes bacterium]|nr:putative rane associated hydrolase [Bacteroidota bacterium]
MALVFSTTPSGLRNDLTVLNDAIASNPRNPPFNNSWNTFWDVKTTQNENGWFLEMRIPFSSMRFKEDNGKVIMGLICFRRIAHKNEVDIFPAIPPDWGTFSTYRASKANEVAFDGIHSKKPFYIAPYVLAGYQQDNVLNESGTAYELSGNSKLSAGLDAKYGLTNNLTLDVTVNTDFAQVEADDQQINLTRFSLFFPEKRTFFQERSSIFNFGFEGKSNIFYSRQIGLNKGEQVPILGGGRITGMAGKWDIGFLDLQTQSFDPSDTLQSSLPSENFGVLRIRRQV